MYEEFRVYNYRFKPPSKTHANGEKCIILLYHQLKAAYREGIRLFCLVNE